MKPMTFKEFLYASKQDMLVDFINNIEKIEPISEPIFNKMNDYLREYYISGGMPEAVKTWVETKDLEILENVQNNSLGKN